MPHIFLRECVNLFSWFAQDLFYNVKVYQELETTTF
jgi:hypothetical protein